MKLKKFKIRDFLSVSFGNCLICSAFENSLQLTMGFYLTGTLQIRIKNPHKLIKKIL
jgi:hypothetical protein